MAPIVTTVEAGDADEFVLSTSVSFNSHHGERVRQLQSQLFMHSMSHINFIILLIFTYHN